MIIHADDLVEDDANYGGWYRESVINATYCNGRFGGDSFFDGFSVYSRLLNFFVNNEKLLANGKRSNVKAHNLFDYYEWVVNCGSMDAIAHYGKTAFQRKLHDFHCAGFDVEFIDKMNNYTAVDAPSFRQWKGYNPHFVKRPMRMVQ